MREEGRCSVSGPRRRRKALVGEATTSPKLPLNRRLLPTAWRRKSHTSFSKKAS
jgi:hypothetical protein